MKQNYLGQKFWMRFSVFFVFLSLVTMIAEAKPSVKKSSFGKTAAGSAVDIYTLTNSKGAEARITTYGARVVSLKMPDKKGIYDDVVLGYETLDGYLADEAFIGGIVGRYANRIAKGKFSLNGKEYTLAKNDGENHLHGGVKSYDEVVWNGKSSVGKDGAKLELDYLSRDGEEGYPGNLAVKVVYTLTENHELRIEYFATTDQDTVFNPTNHSYFNLAGAGSGTILNHQLRINADKFTPTDAGSIPTGELRDVAGTPLDFRQPTVIGARIDEADEQLKFGKGYDQNWVLNKKGNELSLAAVAYEPTSGRVLEVLTTEPGIQFYSGNFLSGAKGKNGKAYGRREAFCLETQHFPDSPNKPNFPTTVLKKGEKFSSVTIYKFSTR